MLECVAVSAVVEPTKEFIAAEVLAGDRGAVGVAGAGVGGGSRTGVDVLVEEELPTLSAPSK